jgi:ATP-dependent DNA helicase RecQ
MQKTHSVLKTFFGFDHFRPLQEEIVNHIINGNSCLVLMPTGGGKSICFQVPALSLEGTAVVISPLIALMKDQVEGLKSNGIKAAFLNSSLSRDEEERIISECYNGSLKLLYLSPEKAITIADSLLSQMNVSMIAIDEAHCISQWGHDFRPEYTQLQGMISRLPKVPVVALTATADKTTRRDILKQLGMEDARIFVSSFDRPNIRLEVRNRPRQKDKINELIQFIEKRQNASGIIYCLSRKGTEKLAAELQVNGIPCEHYHAGMNAAERTRVQDAFIRDDVKIICATIAFGMGIDKSNVRWVVHYNLPSKIEGYYQEIGRAGRDGMKSDALLFFSVSDLMMLTRFASESGQPELNKEKLRRMEQFAESKICRRKVLLNYFGETMIHNCQNCDVCSSPSPVIDATIAAQKALSAAIRSGEKAGINLLIQILRGSSSAAVLEKGFDRIKTYGIGKEHSFETWQAYILQFLLSGIIEMAYDDSFALRVTETGKQVLAGKLKVEISEPAARKAAFDHDLPDLDSEEDNVPGHEYELFEKLRRLRKSIADTAGLPPYVVFTDRTLSEMVHQFPLTREAMLSVQGISVGKMDKYGHQFLELLRENATDEQIQNAVSPADLLTDENISAWIQELDKNSMPVTPTEIGWILTASSRCTTIQGSDNLSFYGLLQDRMKQTEVIKIIRDFFERHPGVEVRHSADYFFGAETFNQLPESTLRHLKSTIASLPVNRPDATITNEYILNSRKTHPRSYENWLEPEITLFKSIIERTNNLELISGIFQRSPDSIKSYYKKTFQKKEAVG